jgi:signal peptidase II
VRRVLSLALLVLLLDQASKWIILQWVMQPPRVIEVTSFFNLVLVYNRGVSFGLLASDLWWKPFALAALALLIVGGVLWWVRRQTAALPLYGSGLIVGGAVGRMALARVQCRRCGHRLRRRASAARRLVWRRARR